MLKFTFLYFLLSCIVITIYYISVITVLGSYKNRLKPVTPNFTSLKLKGICLAKINKQVMVKITTKDDRKTTNDEYSRDDDN